MKESYDELYQAFRLADEQRKKENFNAFMMGLESGLVDDLNKAYKSDCEKYKKLLVNVKSQGIKVFRNEQGLHKLKFIQ